MKTLLVILLFSLSACSTLKQIQSSMNRVPDRHWAEDEDPDAALSDVEKCDQNKASCNLEVYTNIKERQKVIEACLSKGKKQEECAKTYTEMVMAKITLRYPYANWSYAETWCKSEPIKCDNSLKGLGEFEAQLKESHIVNRRAKRQAEREAEESARLDRAVKINAIMNTYRPPAYKPTNCTSTRIGNTVNTNCY